MISTVVLVMPIITVMYRGGFSLLEASGPITLTAILVFDAVGVIMIIVALKIEKKHQILLSSKLSSM
jgi:hypothetical protein